MQVYALHVAASSSHHRKPNSCLISIYIIWNTFIYFGAEHIYTKTHLYSTMLRAKDFYPLITSAACGGVSPLEHTSCRFHPFITIRRCRRRFIQLCATLTHYSTTSTRNIYTYNTYPASASPHLSRVDRSETYNIYIIHRGDPFSRHTIIMPSIYNGDSTLYFGFACINATIWCAHGAHARYVVALCETSSKSFPYMHFLCSSQKTRVR